MYKDEKNNYEYESNDKCEGDDENRCCISKDLGDCGNALLSKTFNLFVNKDCEKDTCDDYIEEELPPPDLYCENGIKDTKSQVCCHSSCGICGGSGCSNRGFGAEYCCSSNIKEVHNTCDNVGAPCYNYAEKDSFVNNDKTHSTLEWWEILLIIVGTIIGIILIILAIIKLTKSVIEQEEENKEDIENQ